MASNAGSVKSTATAATRTRTTSVGKKSVVTPPLPGPKKLSPAGVPRPGSIHSSISGGSTTSNLTFRKVVRKTVLKKRSSDVEELPCTPKEGMEKVAESLKQRRTQSKTKRWMKKQSPKKLMETLLLLWTISLWKVLRYPILQRL